VFRTARDDKDRLSFADGVLSPPGVVLHVGQWLLAYAELQSQDVAREQTHLDVLAGVAAGSARDAVAREGVAGTGV
jgi:hypothetical protein